MGDDELILCRCEEVTLAEVRAALAEGACTVHDVKLATRAGMGYCQGRICRALVERLIAATGRPDHGNRPARVRPPVRPVSLSRLALGMPGEGER